MWMSYKVRISVPCDMLALILTASVTLTLAEPNDMAAMRRLFANTEGAMSEDFILVAFPGMMLAGFYFVLQQLQNLASKDDEIAFAEFITPITEKPNPVLLPPKYAMSEGFTYKCDVLQKEATNSSLTPLSLNPSMAFADGQIKEDFIRRLGLTTTLDHGQATALCDNLCRGLAFTQGISSHKLTSFTLDKTVSYDADGSHRSSRHRENFSWNCLSQSPASIIHGTKAYSHYMPD